MGYRSQSLRLHGHHHVFHNLFLLSGSCHWILHALMLFGFTWLYQLPSSFCQPSPSLLALLKLQYRQGSPSDFFPHFWSPLRTFIGTQTCTIATSFPRSTLASIYLFATIKLGMYNLCIHDSAKFVVKFPACKQNYIIIIAQLFKYKYFILTQQLVCFGNQATNEALDVPYRLFTKIGR